MNNQNKFYSSLGLLLLLNAVIKPIWIFGIDRQVQNIVGAQQYGTFFSLFNLSVIFSFLLDAGITIFYNSRLAANENLLSQAGGFIKLKLLLALLYTGIVLGAAYLSHIEEWRILLQVVLIQVFTSFFLFLRAIITAQQWFRTDAWLSVIDKGLMIILCAGFIYLPLRFGKISVHLFLLIQVISIMLACSIAAAVLFFKNRNFIPGWKLSLNKLLLRQALPFALIVFLMSVHNRADAFLLERIHPDGATEAGKYAAAWRLLDAFNMVGFLIASFLLPYIARMFSEKKSFTEAVLYSRHLLVFFSIGVIIISVLLAPWIYQLLYYTNSPADYSVLQCCIPSLLAIALLHIYGTALTATGNIVSFCSVTVMAAALNIILNLIFIPSMGARGSCLAALISQGLYSFAVMLLAIKKLNLTIHFRSWLIYIFTAAMVTAIGLSGKELNVNEWLIVPAVITVVVIIAHISKLISFKNFVSFLKK
jgi:O-antigen/teichoic acid export membrane protein